MPSGYSGTPLWKKLGCKPGYRIAVIAPPEDFDLDMDGIPPDIAVIGELQPEMDVILWFCTSVLELDKALLEGRKCMKTNAGLWISWPKKASKMTSELNENVVREDGLKTGLVDNKICAVNEQWSGLRFVIRLKDR